MQKSFKKFNKLQKYFLKLNGFYKNLKEKSFYLNNFVKKY